MAEQGGKLSLVSQFDDLCRYGSIFNDGLESEMLKFVRNQEQCRLRWLQCDRELKNLQTEYDTTIQELSEWKKHCEDLRKKLASEQKRREDAERKLNELNKLFGEVKEVVNRDNTLADHTKEKFAMWQRYEPLDAIQEDDLADLSNFYDKTEDDLDIDLEEVEEKGACSQAGKRRSSARKSGFTPPKRKKSSEEVFLASKENTSVVATTTIRVGPDRRGDLIATSRIDAFHCNPTAPEMPFCPPQSNKEKRRSRSEPEAIIIVEPASQDGFRAALNSDPNPDRLYPTHMIAAMAQQENVHMNVNNKVTPRITPNSNVPFRQHNCRSVCHPECKSSVPVPCIPANHTPTTKTSGLTLADFVPSEPPFVPLMIYHCVNEVESRGLSEVGLYRLSAKENEVKELKQKFLKGRGVTNVSQVDIHVVCALIKDFLRSVETLIPRTMWKEFTDAAVMPDPQDCLTALYQGISQLPQHNKDTLAFLILHWQRVAESPEVKMPVKNLATVLGPTVVGFSSNNLDSSSMLREQVLIVKVVEKLLQVSSDYWNSLLNPEQNTLLLPNILKPSDLITPDPRTTSTLYRTGSATNTLQNATPRLGTLNLQRRGGPRKFFASPSLQN